MRYRASMKEQWEKMERGSETPGWSGGGWKPGEGGEGGGGTTNYNGLSNKPSIEGVTLEGNKTAGSFGLAKKTEIPAAYDDTALANRVTALENKPSGTSNYSQLSNKPQINGVELSGNKKLTDIDNYAKLYPAYTEQNGVRITNTAGASDPYSDPADFIEIGVLESDYDKYKEGEIHIQGGTSFGETPIDAYVITHERLDAELANVNDALAAAGIRIAALETKLEGYEDTAFTIEGANKVILSKAGATPPAPQPENMFELPRGIYDAQGNKLGEYSSAYAEYAEDYEYGEGWTASALFRIRADEIARDFPTARGLVLNESIIIKDLATDGPLLTNATEGQFDWIVLNAAEQSYGERKIQQDMILADVPVVNTIYVIPDESYAETTIPDNKWGQTAATIDRVGAFPWA